MRKILAPHKEQDGWVYVRVSRGPQPDDLHLSYNDSAPTRRIISSRRVEHGVETGDFLRLCAGEGLSATYVNRQWWLAGHASGPIGRGDTLRIAYDRYHAAADA